MTGEHQPLLRSDQIANTRHATSSLTATARRRTKHFLTSKMGHYSVLALVSIDVTAIFIDLILQLETCEGRLGTKEGEKAQEVLGDLSLIFSCLFMAELLASIWAFGWQYFKSKFHCLDATVIVAGFVLDVLLRGVLEEVGSLVVVLRLWRVFKIIEELSAGAEEQLEPLQEKVEDLEKECGNLREQVKQLKAQQSSHVGVEAT